MIDFTLSKLNLLVFVLAVTAIVLFFMNTVNNNLRTRQSYELVYKVGQELKTGIDNPSYCSIKYVDIPRRLQLNSGITSSYNINYIMNISAYEIPDSDGEKKVVLSILDGAKKNLFAAYDLDFEGEIIFYEWEFVDGTYIFTNDKDYIDLRPHVINSIDHSLVVAKKVTGGTSTIHIFSCGKRNNIPGCSDSLAKFSGTDFITYLVETKKIDCACVSTTIARNYAPSLEQQHLINACQ